MGERQAEKTRLSVVVIVGISSPLISLRVTKKKTSICHTKRRVTEKKNEK
jgi:hypothetical protein